MKLAISEVEGFVSCADMMNVLDDGSVYLLRWYCLVLKWYLQIQACEVEYCRYELGSNRESFFVTVPFDLVYRDGVGMT